MKHPIIRFTAFLLIAASSSPGQQLLPAQTVEEKPNQHFLWIFPNYGSLPEKADYHPLTASEKFTLAGQDTWNLGTLVLSAAMAGEAQLSNSNRAFGQGGAGYAKYLGARYGDFLLGNYMTEGVFPTLLHQDPRYFRRGTGSGWSRVRYAVTQSFVTRGDSGKLQPNYSEWLGSSAAVAVSTSYYADNRRARDAASRLGIQIGLDTAANILKEFCPDIERRFRRKHSRN